MIVEETLLGFILFLGLSLSIPIDVPNAEPPVDLSYICIKANTNDRNGDLAPIILLHGLSNFKESWYGIPMKMSLNTGRRVCVADLRNHGESPWSDISDIDTMASDVNLLLKSLNADKVILLGHSLGGKISVHFSLKNPEKVEKLIVEDMRPNGLTEHAENDVMFIINTLNDALSALPNGIEENNAKLAMFRYMKEAFLKMNQSFALDETSAGILPITCSKEKCGFKFNMEVFKKYLEADRNYLTLSTGLFDKPALFVYGSLSPFKVGEDKEAILKLFPKAKLIAIEGAGHVVHVRSEFTDEVIKFINSEE